MFITLKYKGPEHRRIADWVTDALKVALALYLPFIFKVVDSKGAKLDI